MPPDLHEGAAGEEVRAIQQALNIQPGLPGPPLENALFDAAMTQRLIAFQTLKHLPPTGIVDQATRLALYPFGVASVTVLATRLTLPVLAAPALSNRIPHFSYQQLTPPSFAAPRLGSSWEPLPQSRWGPLWDAHTDLRDRVGWSDATRLSVDWTHYTNKFRLDAIEDPSKPCFEHVTIPNARVPLPIISPMEIQPFAPTGHWKVSTPGVEVSAFNVGRAAKIAVRIRLSPAWKLRAAVVLTISPFSIQCRKM